MTMTWLALFFIGLSAGVLAGMFGIGGGIIIVPVLMYILRFPPHEAIGTSLAALLLPVGILGALEYYRSGYVDLRHAALIALGLFLGAFLGARVAIALRGPTLARLFGLIMILAGVWTVARPSS